MAVYTDVSDEELAEFLTAYDLGGLHSCKGIAEGVENSNFLLLTDKGQFILTLYEKRVNEADLPFFLALMAHLAGEGIATPLPVKARDGQALRRLAGRPAAIVTFLDGMSARRPTAEQCGQLGEALAKLHAAGAGFSTHSRVNALGPSGWRPLLERSGPAANTVQAGLYGFADEELVFLETHWPKGLPAGVIHADLFPDNVFFLKGSLSGIIDLYFACNDLLAYDLAICLNAWCFEIDYSFNITKGAALIAGYERVRPLLPEEREALPVLCRGAAIRFMLTRLYDWLNVPPGALVKPHDPMAYYRRLRTHQKVGSAAEYGAR
ncbi:MAG: homoserine kinase [Beijerinckiaceae bacterium]